MKRSIQSFLLALLAVAFLAACNSDGSDVKDDARESIEATDANVTPTTNPTAADPNAQPAAPEGPTTSMTFENTEFDFGTIDEGEMVKHTFSFTNTGNEPLIISNAKGSCGCTVPKWPREPVGPGETAEVSVEFNSKGKKGARTQRVTLTANTNPPQTFLTLKGNVTPAEGAADQPVQVNK